MSVLLNRAYHEIRCLRMGYNLHLKKWMQSGGIHHLRSTLLPSKNHVEAEQLVQTFKHSLQKDQGRNIKEQKQLFDKNAYFMAVVLHLTDLLGLTRAIWYCYFIRKRVPELS